MKKKVSAQKTSTKAPAKPVAAPKATAAPKQQGASTQQAPIESTTDECSDCGSRHYFEVGGVKFCAAGCGDKGRHPIPQVAATPVREVVKNVVAVLANEPPVAGLGLDEEMVAGEVASGDSFIVATGEDATQKEAYETVSVDAGSGSTLADIYDREMKLWYVVDNSGSMADGMDKETDQMVKEFQWPPEMLLEFRKRLADEQGSLPTPAPDADADDEDEFDEEYADAEPIVNWLDSASVTDLQLQMKILDEQLNDKYKIPLVPVKSYGADTKGPMRKLDVVKTESKSFVRERFQKFPRAKVGVFSFNQSCTLRAPVGSFEASVYEAIDSMYPNGGTSIIPAIERVMKECGRLKKEIGMHHIVLISDGFDNGALDAEKLIPQMKEIGIVFDFIFVANRALDENGYERALVEKVAAVLRKVCEATGGEFTEVNKVSEFKQKFLSVSTRLCLPPASGK
jgi:hypothetical protein